MIEMGVSMEDVADGTPQLLHLTENTFRCATWIDDDRLLRDRITDD